MIYHLIAKFNYFQLDLVLRLLMFYSICQLRQYGTVYGSNSKIMLKSYFFLNKNKYETYNYESTCELKT